MIFIPLSYLNWGERTPEQLAKIFKDNEVEFVILECESEYKRIKYDSVEFIDGECVLKLENQIQIALNRDYYVYKATTFLILKTSLIQLDDLEKMSHLFFTGL